MHLIGRRNFLAGLGLSVGSTLLGAMVKQMLPEALGQTAGRKRFYLYFNRMGVNDNPPTESYFPRPGPTESSFVLGDQWSPLERYRNELLIMRGFYNPHQHDLHGNNWSLTVAPSGGKSTVSGPSGLPSLPGGISLDRQLAQAIGKDDPQSSVLIGTEPRFLAVSADGPGKTYPVMANPVQTYASLFGAGVPQMSDASAADRLALEQSVLDFLKADVARMSGRLAAPERAKLDQYLESLRGMERKLTSFVSSGAAGCAKAIIDPTLAKNYNNDIVSPGLIDANMELSINALICGITRIMTHAFGYDAHYEFLGFDGLIGEHSMWHGGPPAKHYAVYKYHATNMVKVRERLNQFREGDGTMADRLLLMIFNEGGGFHHDGYDRLWVMLLGSAGGYFKTGRYLSFPKNNGGKLETAGPNQRCVSDAFVSVLNGMGVPVNTFGAPEACKGPLPGLT